MYSVVLCCHVLYCEVVRCVEVRCTVLCWYCAALSGFVMCCRVLLYCVVLCWHDLYYLVLSGLALCGVVSYCGVFKVAVVGCVASCCVVPCSVVVCCLVF